MAAISIVDIADAVKANLNAGSFSMPFDAVRAFVPRYTLEELQTLRVTVVPRGRTRSTASRTDTQKDYQVDIGIHKKIQDEEAEVPILIDLAEQIIAHTERRHLEIDAKRLLWLATENEPVYSQEHLVGQKVFFSFLRLTYRALG